MSPNLGSSAEDGTAAPVAARRAAVMADVARVAGVSHQTVSRVLNNHSAVRPDTRERVLAAIRELDYRPNSAARALVTRRSSTIGIISFDTTLYGPASTQYGIERAARKAGYYVSVVSLESLRRKAVHEALERLADQSVEGAIVVAPTLDVVEALVERSVSLPIVAVESGGPPGVPMVCVDQEEGARLVTHHLLECGAPTVWHVAGPQGWLEAEARVRGWRWALNDASVAAPEVLHGDWGPASGYAAGAVLAERALGRRDVAAVFVANDQMALGVLRAFHEGGVRVPEDVLVGGFDDVPEAAYFTPPLTTVHQDFTAVGQASIELLLAQLAGGTVEEQRVVPPRLVLRQSTGAIPGDPPRRSEAVMTTLP